MKSILKAYAMWIKPPEEYIGASFIRDRLECAIDDWIERYSNELDELFEDLHNDEVTLDYVEEQIEEIFNRKGEE